MMGCSSSSVVTPNNTGNIVPDGLASANLLPENNGILGLFQAHIELDKGIVNFEPMRSSALTDVIESVDLTNFLTLFPCTNCAKLNSVGLDSDSHVVVEIGIKHPFPAGDPFKPITGRNRADLHVFNVEGIIVTSSPGITFPGINQKISGVKLVNADGYSGYLDPVLDLIYPTDATLHPYITHFDDYSAGNFSPGYQTGFISVVDPPPSGNLVMPMGSNYDFKNYIFNVSSAEPLNFVLAIGCTYPLTTENKAQRFQPAYRVPQHCKKAASEVSVEIIENKLHALDTASTAKIEIKIVDINSGVPVGTENDKMFADSSVKTISVDIPGVMTEPLEVDGTTSLSGTGHSPSDPLVYDETITNTSGADIGIYSGLVKVLDNYLPGLNEFPMLEHKDGIQRVAPDQNPITGLFAINEFATYQTFEIEVTTFTEPPIWPVHQGNSAHTGMVGLDGPSGILDNPSWQANYPPGWNFYGNPLPVFLSKTTAFVSTTGDGGPLPAIAINLSDHTVKWSQQFHDDMQNWLNVKGISADGTVVLTCETGYNRMIGLDAEDGHYLWEVPGIIKVDSYPTLDLDGNFIVPVENVGVISIKPDGTVNWTSPIGDPYYSVPAVGENGVIYLTYGGQWEGQLGALDPVDGHLKWKTESIGDLRGNATVVHPNQTIICHGGNGFYCFRDLGDSAEQVWKQSYSCPFYASCGVGPSGDIYLLDYDGVLRRINPADGITITSTSIWGDPGLSGNFVRMAIGADGLIYFAYYLYNANKAYFACANPDCSLRWKHYGGQWFMGDGLYSAPALGQDGTVYSYYRTTGLVAWRD